MGFEQSGAVTGGNQEAAKAMRERVDKLRGMDSPYQDSVEDLAIAEDSHRDVLSGDGITGKLADKYGDIHSTVVMEKMEAQKERQVDELTGLRNRAALMNEIPQIMRLEQRNGRDCSILMLDMDYFKKVNDSYGHQAGDAALKQLAVILRESLRRISDFIYRYGGEEFVVFLSDTDVKGAATVAENIRKAVEASVIQVVGEDGKSVELKKTISIGVAGMRQVDGWDSTSPEEVKDKVLMPLIAAADSALYQSKESGRNMITEYRKTLASLGGEAKIY